MALANAVTTEDASETETTSAVTTTIPAAWTMPAMQDVWVNGEHYDEYGRRIKPLPKTMGSIDFFAIMSDKNGKYSNT